MKKMTLLLAAGLLSITAAACGGQQAQTDQSSDDSNDQPETVIVYRDSTDQQDDSGSSNTSSSSTTSTQTQTGDTDADDNMQQTSELPQDFALPVPDDYQVVRAGETQNEVAVDLQVPDGQQAYDYYTQALQDEGFVIEESGIDNDSMGFDADIDFVSDQYDGSIDFSGENVEIDYDILNASSGSGSSNDGGSQQTSSTELPQGFPVTIPDGLEVQNVREGGDSPDDAGDITVVLAAQDGQQAFDAFNQSLQGDGFTIEDSEIDNDSNTFEADIDFDSADYDGNVDINGDTVEIDLDDRNSGTDD